MIVAPSLRERTHADAVTVERCQVGSGSAEGAARVRCALGRVYQQNDVE
jgi:hypothetical protein